MRILLILFFGLIGVSTTSYSGVISYETSISFDDGLTDQLDRRNVGAVYERLTKTGATANQDFWEGCDELGIFGTTATCSGNASSYNIEADRSMGLGWNELEPNLGENFGIPSESGSVEAQSVGRGSGSSSLEGSFRIGFSDEMLNEILSGTDQGIRFGYVFSWLGFGKLDDFDGVTGQWASMALEGEERVPDGLSILSSFRSRVTAHSLDYSLRSREEPKVILDETLSGKGEIGMIFPPDPASYGFTKGDIVSFRLEVEQRLWTERSEVKVPEPSSIGLLFAGFFSLFVLRFFSKRPKSV